MKNDLIRFITESNGIEGICREPLDIEIEEAERFLELNEVTLGDVVDFIGVYEPKAILRYKTGLNVTVGNHIPPLGGMSIIYALESILEDVNNFNKSSFDIHCEYETLHPFTDGNGRSGRMLWLWMEYKRLGYLPKLGFLHSFYYQALSSVRNYD